MEIKEIIFVLGMHRSGTSLVTGLLHKGGLALGKNLLMHAKDNPKGHFEHRKFININNDILKSCGGSWRSPPKFEATKFNAKTAARALEFLRSWKVERIGLKDPRICLTFYLWHTAIKKLFPQCVIKAVVVDRPDIQIATSLRKRNDMPINNGLKLIWKYKKYMIENLVMTGTPFIITYYEDYFKDAKAALKPVIEHCGLDMPTPFDLRTFVDPKLWHNRQKVKS